MTSPSPGRADDELVRVDLSHRVAVVTGGSRGIGRAIVVALLGAGARVLVVGRDEARVKAMTDLADDRFGRDHAAGIARDVTAREAASEVVATAVEAFGQVDVLINNAALGQRYIADSPRTVSTRFWESDPDRIRDLFEVNVIAPFLLASAIAPYLLERGWGRIINVSTSLTTMQRALNSPYGPSKAALEVGTLIWAQELAGTGVTVNTVVPGHAVDTDMVLFAKGGPLLQPEMMVPPVLWLASERSNGVSGARFVATRWDATLPVDEAAALAREALVFRA